MNRIDKPLHQLTKGKAGNTQANEIRSDGGDMIEDKNEIQKTEDKLSKLVFHKIGNSKTKG